MQLAICNAQHVICMELKPHCSHLTTYHSLLTSTLHFKYNTLHFKTSTLRTTKFSNASCTLHVCAIKFKTLIKNHLTKNKT